MSEELRLQIEQAATDSTALEIIGGHSKAFYGRQATGAPLNVAAHSGIVDYQPSELVITARAGTPLSELESSLDQAGQCLPFEPPHFGATATLGGTLACGFSGPRRAFPNAGGSSARDLVLGTKVINGKAEILEFGGQVMKNVAGYDLSRLMVGAMGSLGLILEASLKVLPKPELERTRSFAMPEAEAITQINHWMGQALPVSAGAWHEQQLHVRLSGTAAGVNAAVARLGGDELADSAGFWRSLREHQHPFFQDRPQSLWRLSMPGNNPPLPLEGDTLIDWGGAQRWFYSDAEAGEIRTVVESAGGSATLFRGGQRDGEVFHPLKPGIAQLHRNLKQALDPKGVFNPGRLYADL